MSTNRSKGFGVVTWCLGFKLVKLGMRFGNLGILVMNWNFGSSLNLDIWNRALGLDIDTQNPKIMHQQTFRLKNNLSI